MEEYLHRGGSHNPKGISAAKTNRKNDCIFELDVRNFRLLISERTEYLLLNVPAIRVLESKNAKAI